MQVSGKHSAVFFVQIGDVEYNEEIDRTEFTVDHWRAANSSADSEVHVVKSRQFDSLLGLISDETYRISTGCDAEYWVKMSIGAELTICLTADLFVLGKDRAAAEEVTLSGMFEISKQGLPKQI